MAEKDFEKELEEIFDDEFSDTGLTITGPDGEELKVVVSGQVMGFLYENDLDLENDIIAAVSEAIKNQKKSFN